MGIVPGCVRWDGFSVDLRIKAVIAEDQAWHLSVWGVL